MKGLFLVGLLALSAQSFGEDAHHLPALCGSIPPRLALMRRPESLPGANPYIYRRVGTLSLRLHVFEPQQPTEHRGAIVLFFGGGWTWGTVEQFTHEAQYLASRGMVAVVPDYRVLCRDHSSPLDAVSDAREAMRWVRAHADELHIDPHRIAAGGESAGAQMALMTALTEDHEPVSAKPSALVLYSAGIDLTDSTDFVRDRWGNTVADALPSISPLQQLKSAPPPTLILNGLSDTTTPYAVAEKYCARAKQLGGLCTLVGFPDADHGFFNPPRFPAKHSLGGKWYAQGLAKTDEFLDSLGYLYDESP